MPASKRPSTFRTLAAAAAVTFTAGSVKGTKYLVRVHDAKTSPQVFKVSRTYIVR